MPVLIAYAVCIIAGTSIYFGISCAYKLHFYSRYREDKCESCTAEIIDRRGVRNTLIHGKKSVYKYNVRCRVRFNAYGQEIVTWLPSSPRVGETVEILYRRDNPKKAVPRGAYDLNSPGRVVFMIILSIVCVIGFVALMSHAELFRYI